jgi:hypothetical protein
MLTYRFAETARVPICSLENGQLIFDFKLKAHAAGARTPDFASPAPSARARGNLSSLVVEIGRSIAPPTHVRGLAVALGTN